MLNDRILVFAIKLMIITLTALLNIFIVLIFSVFVKKKTFSDFIYLSIGVSDLIIGCLSMSTQLISDIRADTTWPFDQISCVISIHLQYALPDTTLLALLILAVHFYLQLTTFSKPIENLNLVNCIKLLAPWCVATLFWLISISLMIKYDQFNAAKCIILPNFWFKFFKVAIFGYAPLISIIILNFVSIKKLNTRNKRFSNREIVQLIDIAQNKPSIMPTKTFSRSESNSNASSNANNNNNNNNNSNNDNDNNKNNNDSTNNNIINNNNVSFVHSLNSLKITHKAKTYLALSYLNRLFVVPGSNRKNAFVKRKSVFRYSMNRMSVYSRKNRRAVRCILALTFSITITQIVYLISWPLFDQSKETNNSKWISVMYDIGVWFSYLTSLFNPILLCLFNEKVKAHSRKILFRNNRKF